MFSPIRQSIPGLESTSGGDSKAEVLILRREGQTVIVDRDGFTIGSNPQCDLVLSDVSILALHGVIHLQSGAIWIEAAATDARILVNQQICRRMALRNDDQIQMGSVSFVVQLKSRGEAIADQARAMVDEDLSLLTAEELCDRIIAEQSLISEFDDGRRAGWDALLRAIEAAKDDVLQDEPEPIADQDSNTGLDQAQMEELLHQIQELNQTIEDRTQQLNDREKEVLESTKILEQNQLDVSQRLDDLLDQLNKTDPPNELRASA